MNLFNNVPGLPKGSLVKGIKLYCKGRRLVSVFLRVSHHGDTLRFKVTFEGNSRIVKSVEPISVGEYRKIQKGALNAATDL